MKIGLIMLCKYAIKYSWIYREQRCRNPCNDGVDQAQDGYTLL